MFEFEIIGLKISLSRASDFRLYVCFRAKLARLGEPTLAAGAAGVARREFSAKPKVLCEVLFWDFVMLRSWITGVFCFGTNWPGYEADLLWGFD